MRRLLIVPAVLVLSLACSDQKKPATAASVNSAGLNAAALPSAAAGSENDKPTDDPKRSQINIDEAILKACGIQQSDAFFDFDSANVKERDQSVLGQLAQCFSTGALKGRTMQLVGHTDPRGSDEYNRVLGQRRAASVQEFISKKGLSSEQVTTVSRGKADAVGTDETSWAKDRRVDVKLAQ